MEQTESVIIRVAPDAGDHKIAEMQRFGWKLQSREEVIGHLIDAETPDNAVAVIDRAMKEGAPDKKTYQLYHYVELHFVRERYGWETGLLSYWDQCPAASAR
jgi:hypothetical protein